MNTSAIFRALFFDYFCPSILLAQLHDSHYSRFLSRNLVIEYVTFIFFYHNDYACPEWLRERTNYEHKINKTFSYNRRFIEIFTQFGLKIMCFATWFIVKMSRKYGKMGWKMVSRSLNAYGTAFSYQSEVYRMLLITSVLSWATVGNR